MRRNPVKYSKWYQADEPDPETPNPWWSLGTIVGFAAVVFALLALIDRLLKPIG